MSDEKDFQSEISKIKEIDAKIDKLMSEASGDFLPNITPEIMELEAKRQALINQIINKG
jgi:hypothetical protein